jgi:outer membrane protein assembly factor BamD (BamD/ComL family)
MIACGIGLLFQLLAIRSHAQPNLSFEIPTKPKNYENRTLPSERTGNKKFTASRRFYNDLVSRFNYYFNANNKLNEILQHAKDVHIDNYTELLSFYNYSLNVTAKGQIDTIIYKTTAGILLHDLRSDWVDKLYLLMGKAYLYRKDFDSASNVFQYINYAFAPKDNGYDIPIGSNASNTNGVFTIATRENRSLWKRIASFPPGRNESFIWQVRTYIEEGQLVEASSLLELIRSDPNFPPRLQPAYQEMMAYVLYKQQSYEASADHLLLALDNAETKQERARWEYLAGQLYQLANRDSKAILLFERSIQHTIDPLLEVYARMNIVALAAGAEGNAIQKNLDELLKMAKREKYAEHRDIIYYAAAQLELKRKNYTAAHNLLLNSIKYSVSDPLQKQLSFLLLADLNYPIKKYAVSHRYYDSIQTGLLKDEDKKRVDERKPALKIISANEEIISLQDSLQKIALLPPEERDALVKKLYKQLKKEQGIKDASAGAITFGNTLAGIANSQQPDIFGNNSSDFYFLNTSIKAKGSVDFKSKWGTRPNVDNWRRQAAVNNSLTAANTLTPTGEKKPGGIAKKDAPKELSVESMMANLPLTTAMVDSSNAAIIKALLGNALTFQNQLEDYPSAIEMYEELLRRFPNNAAAEQAMFNLVYAYKKTGNPAKADSLSAQLKQNYPSGKFTTQLNKAVAAAGAKKADPAQKQYEDIYNMFLAGRFEEAKEAKLQADKKFGKNYWTPQLLYIESIYYVKQKDDSTAINRLQNIVSLFGKSPLAEKAATMIDVLKRRAQIEYYLTHLDLNKTDEITSRRVDLNTTNTVLANAGRKRDSAINVPKELKAAPKNLADLTNTAPVSTAAEIKKDSVKQAVVPNGLRKLTFDNAVAVKPVENKTYAFNASDTQYVAVILNNVDPIFITEGRNAFNRFNQDYYAEQRIEVFNRKINNQYSFLMFGPFVNAREAITYIDRVRPLAKSRIIPWLTTDKYSFTMISNANMNLLVEKQDVDGYHTFIQQIFPDKF